MFFVTSLNSGILAAHSVLLQACNGRIYENIFICKKEKTWLSPNWGSSEMSQHSGRRSIKLHAMNSFLHKFVPCEDREWESLAQLAREVKEMQIEIEINKKGWKTTSKNI